ncbi:MAG: quinolinate synthase NadA [Dehalococcoidales bacterium]|nr:quinolinate synthase NadA [Dehalococcoidales bacterium]MDD4322277.1 quinolinate synthase NadA [Dehalococcoidales bacterium]MDD4794343.1 quinolinate synthase NadA [Dehalococcoidales bacterium]MDD5498660.1 quinolinate synthase NadA [Dehalococcoidales bacterium]
MVCDDSVFQRIKKLKKKRDAVILVHNYQPGEIHQIADFVGDSLELARLAAKTPAEVIVFCGVHFMAETASILSPDKKVLLPAVNAGCPMADMVTPEALADLKQELPGYAVVTYVNSTAAVKALSDICCTSANAVRVVSSLESNNILFVPDRNLGKYVQSKTGKNFRLWPGYCPVHDGITPAHILECKNSYPQAKVIAHPECRMEVLELADEVLSTGGMVKYCRDKTGVDIIVATDAGMLYRLKKENPSVNFIPASIKATCKDMQMTRLLDVEHSLQEMSGEVKVPEAVRLQAYRAVERMVELG